MEILGFDSKSKPITHALHGGRKLNWEDICLQASKVLSFVDLAGHEKYLKTTVFGMTGCAPDFVMLMVRIKLRKWVNYYLILNRTTGGSKCWYHWHD
jgi:GTPase